jgi:hypothetical protein
MRQVKIVARSKQSSRKKNSSSKSTAAPQGIDSAEASRNNEERRRTLKLKIVMAALLAAVIAAAVGTGFFLLNGGESAWNARDASVATFVGSETCAGCHRAQAELWQTSQHKHAVDHATDKSVLADFSDATFDYYGVKSRFFRKDGKFFVETDGPDGELAVLEMVNYAMMFGDGPIKTFSLRGVKDNPPYLRDERLLTLDDTVEFFNLVLGDKLTPEEKRDLVAFLRAL